MANLNSEMGDVQSELDGVRELLRDELPSFFEFDVVVGSISYNANNNSVSATVEPSADARTQLSSELGGVHVATNGKMEFEFSFAPD